MKSCAFDDPSWATCGQSWTVVRPQDGRRPFIGCQGWHQAIPAHEMAAIWAAV